MTLRSVGDIHGLLQFVYDRIFEGRHFGFEPETVMLRNVLDCLDSIWSRDMEKAEARARKQAERNATDSLQVGFEADRIYRARGVTLAKQKQPDCETVASIEKARKMIVELDRLISDIEAPERLTDGLLGFRSEKSKSH